MKKLFTMLFAVAALALFAFPASAQEVQKPSFMVGEWCEYTTSSGGKVRHEVVETAADGGFTVRVVGNNTQTRVYNSAHHLVRKDSTDYTPEWGGPNFPIKVGTVSGGGNFKYPHPRKPGVDVSATTTIKSTSRDTVRVPAGTFDAIRVEISTAYRLSSGYSNRMDQTIWYPLDPKVKRYLKSEFIDYGIGGMETSEMVACGAGNATQPLSGVAQVQ